MAGKIEELRIESSLTRSDIFVSFQKFFILRGWMVQENSYSCIAFREKPHILTNLSPIAIIIGLIMASTTILNVLRLPADIRVTYSAQITFTAILSLFSLIVGMIFAFLKEKETVAIIYHGDKHYMLVERGGEAGKNINTFLMELSKVDDSIKILKEELQEEIEMYNLLRERYESFWGSYSGRKLLEKEIRKLMEQGLTRSEAIRKHYKLIFGEER